MSVTQAHLETLDLARADVFAYIEVFSIEQDASAIWVALVP